MIEKTPTPEHDSQTVMDHADRLSSALEGFTGEMTDIKKESHRSKIRDLLLAISLVLDVVLTVFIGGIVYQNHQLTQELQTAQVASCQSSNVVRHEDVKLWNEALAKIAPPPYKSASEATGVAKFREQINTTFAQHNCSISAQQTVNNTSTTVRH